MNEIAIDADNSHKSIQTHPQLSKSDIFGILQNDRRRHVLEILRTQGNQSVRSLSEEIARLESETEEPKSSVRKSIYVSLLQTHIPKMESLQIIIYNREHDTIKLLPAAHNFDIFWKPLKKAHPLEPVLYRPEHACDPRQHHNLLRSNHMGFKLPVDDLYQWNLFCHFTCSFAPCPKILRICNFISSLIICRLFAFLSLVFHHYQ